MSDDNTKRLDVIEQKALVDFDSAVPDVSRFGRAGVGILARQAPAYVREVATPLVEEIERLTAQRNAAMNALRHYEQTTGMMLWCLCCGAWAEDIAGDKPCQSHPCDTDCALDAARKAVTR